MRNNNHQKHACQGLQHPEDIVMLSVVQVEWQTGYWSPFFFKGLPEGYPMTINRKICWRKGISQLLILGHRNPGETCGGIHGNMVYRSHCCGRLCHCINTMSAGALFTAVSGNSAWHSTTVMVFAGGILSRSESQERAHATWEASGLRVRFMQTMWLGWRRVAHSSRGGGSMFLPRFFRETSSERRSGPVHLVEGPEEAPGIARGITWPAPLACYQHNPTSDEEQENGRMDGYEIHKAVQHGWHAVLCVLQCGELGGQGPCGGIKWELAVFHCDTD